MSSPDSAALLIGGSVGAALALPLYIRAARARRPVQWIFIVVFAVSGFTAGAGAFQRYESRNVFYRHLGFPLSGESKVLRYDPDWFERDPAYRFEIALAPDDAERIAAFLESPDGAAAAVEPAAESRGVRRQSGWRTHENRRGAIWFRFDYDPARMIGWLVITTT